MVMPPWERNVHCQASMPYTELKAPLTPPGAKAHEGGRYGGSGKRHDTVNNPPPFKGKTPYLRSSCSSNDLKLDYKAKHVMQSQSPYTHHHPELEPPPPLT